MVKNNFIKKIQNKISTANVPQKETIHSTLRMIDVVALSGQQSCMLVLASTVQMKLPNLTGILSSLKRYNVFDNFLALHADLVYQLSHLVSLEQIFPQLSMFI